MGNNRCLRWLPWLLLALSLSANVAGFRGLKSLYAREWAVRRHPVGTGPWPSTGEASAPAVLLLGDSRVKLWPAFPLPGHRVVNAGVGGETTQQMLLRLPAVLDDVRPAVVVIQAGVNDLRTLPLFPAEAEEIEAQCQANLRELVRACQSRGARVVLTPIWRTMPPEWWRQPIASSHTEAARVRVNAALERSLPPGAVWLDLDSLLAPADFRDPYHLHPSAYSRLVSPVADAVASLP